MDNNSVRNWYNEFSKKQSKTGVNLRHYTIMNFLIDAGLQKNHRVLEIGCGIGTLTGLIHSYIKKGKLVATDISDESINVAKKRMRNSDSVEFFVTDMQDFSYPEKFDFIVLPDVLEHIPVEEHKNLFHVLANLMHDNSTMMIHIPHPYILDYIRTHNPEKLQIIDQSLRADALLKDVYANGLTLVSYQSYCLTYNFPDYALIKLRKDVPYKNPMPTSKAKIIYKKFVARAKFRLAAL